METQQELMEYYSKNTEVWGRCSYQMDGQDISTGMGEGGVPAEWTKAIIVPVYKGKGRKGTVGAIKGINLLSIPGKVYGKIITEVQRLTEEKISEEQGCFRKGRGCVDQIFSFRMVVEKNIKRKGKNYTLPSWIWKKLMAELTGWHCEAL